MFDRREYRSFNTRAERLHAPMHEFWSKEGFMPIQVTPWQMQGESYDSRIGLKKKFSLTLHESGGITYMDLQIEAKVTDLGLVGGAAAAFICFPIAAIAGAVSYNEYQKDAAELNCRFWGYMDTVSSAVPN